ncbi:MAG: hypothetical protein QM490_04880 [Candidatus Gracilibacteria bacterium]
MINEKILENKTCKLCNSSFDITDKDLEFYDKISPIFVGKKIQIPTPTFCSDCRQQRRLAWINESKLYRRLCDGTNKTMLLMYPEQTLYKVYSSEYWHSDKWDPMDYGIDIDFNQSFFKQMKELQLDVPRMGRSVLRLENSDYSNNASNLKDCYLSFNGGNAEKLFYCIGFKDSNNCIDCRIISSSDNCYECIDCSKCYNLLYGESCEDVQDSKYIKNCNSCSFCFACTNLNNKKYCIENIKYTKEEYEKLIKELSKKYSKEKFKNFCSKTYIKFIQFRHSDNVIGDYISNSKNVYYSFNINDGEDVRYSYDLTGGSKDVMDVTQFGWGISNILDSISVGIQSSNLLFCYQTYENCSYLIYCDSCISCKNCLFCVSLRNKEYCIFNKQYTKEEYKKLALKTLTTMNKDNEWGEFFPFGNSPFFYNETQAIQYFPLTKYEALEKGFNWQDLKQEYPEVKKVILAKKLPNDIKNIPDDILNRAIECEITKKIFRITKGELEFYRKHNLPIPKRHPDQRNLDRLEQMNPRKLYDRACDNCKKEIKTTYSPKRPEIIYCEDCYNKEIY